MSGITVSSSSKWVSHSTSPATSGDITTAEASQLKPFHLNWVFANDGVSSPVLPWNIRRDGSSFLAKKDSSSAWRAFASFDDACKFTQVKMLECPLDGRPVPTGKANVVQLLRYLSVKHPSVYQDLMTQSSGRIWTLFVFRDGYFLSKRKLHPEMECRNGMKCHGINGGCSFNHPKMPWCNFDVDPNTRCRSAKCKYNHGRGRVAHDNHVRNLLTPVATTPVAKKAVAPPPAPSKPINPFAALVSDDEEEESDDEPNEGGDDD